MRCVDCGYDLVGLDGFKCPECGRPFDPEDETSFRSGRRRRRRERGYRETDAALVLLGIGALYVGGLFIGGLLVVALVTVALIVVAALLLVTVPVLRNRNRRDRMR